MNDDYKVINDNIFPLLDAVIEHIPSPKIEAGNTQLLITSLDYSTFIGRIAIGRLQRGGLKQNQQISLVKSGGDIKKCRIKECL